MPAEIPIGPLQAWAYRIPTDAPEADGTFAWTATTLVVVLASGGGRTGTGYTYADASLVGLIRGALGHAVEGMEAMDPQAAWHAMRRAVRNLGSSGLAATAISAVDAALWDLKARLLEISLARLLGRYRERVAIYGSGGFTSYGDARLRDQLAGWTQQQGCRWVKMKIGSDPARDPQRVAVARAAIGEAAGLLVDANGAFAVTDAIAMAHGLLAECGVVWFEEPVTSDDLLGMKRVRDSLPAAMELAAGEYVYRLDDARLMLEAEAVDVQQADASRCGGITGFLQVAALCEARHIDLSGHCAPSLHLHAACAAPRFRHLEWFHDHVRIEQILFDGAPVPRDGCIRPDLSRPGLGLEFRFADAERFAAS